MVRRGIRGEKRGIRKTLYMSHVTNDLLEWAKKQSKKLGKNLSESEIVEFIVTSNWREFCEKFGLDEKEVKDDKERKKLLTLEEQQKLSHREFVKYSQETSHERYMRNLLFGDLKEGEVEGESFFEMMPETIWEKLRRKLGMEKETGWQEVKQ